MTKQKCIRGIIVDYEDGGAAGMTASDCGLLLPEELYQKDERLYRDYRYYVVHDILNEITWNKGLPRVHDTSQQGLYGCDTLYKISEMDPIYDADMIADQKSRLRFLKQLLEKYPERRIAGYDYSALDEIEPKERQPPCGNYGDVDGDGYVTHIEGEPCDSTLVARYVYFGWDGIKDETSLTTEEEFIKRADVNGDGKVSMVDAMLIAQYVEGIIDTFPVCEAPPEPVTCTEPTEHFSSSCELLKHYDADGDGVLTHDDVITATNNYYAGILTQPEVMFVIDCYNNYAGVINNKCPGCYGAPCTCTPWQNAECISETQRRQTRTCTPAGCDIEERIVNDPSCGVPPPPPPPEEKTWWQKHAATVAAVGVAVAGAAIFLYSKFKRKE